MDLETAQRKFLELFSALDVRHRASFVVWGEYKIAEFKTGNDISAGFMIFKPVVENGNFKRWLMAVFCGMVTESNMVPETTEKNSSPPPSSQHAPVRQPWESSSADSATPHVSPMRELSFNEDCKAFSAEVSSQKRKSNELSRRVSAKYRALQFPEDVHSSEDKLMCRFCEQCLDFRRLDSVKDHIRSKKHTLNKKKIILENSFEGKNNGDL